MEMVILQTVSCAAMALLGAVIARGWPESSHRSGARHHTAADTAEDDPFARDLAAMMEYGGPEEDRDEA